MGTINYKSGKFLTLGVKPYDENDFLNDPETCEELELDQLESEFEKLETVVEYINDLYQEDYTLYESIIKKYNFAHFEIGLEWGYYEGFCLPVNGVDYLYFDDSHEKKEALKEATLLKKMLLECVDYGLIRVSPGWCTGYSSREESIEAINNAIKEIKTKIQGIPTFKQYFKNKRSA